MPAPISRNVRLLPGGWCCIRGRQRALPPSASGTGARPQGARQSHQHGLLGGGQLSLSAGARIFCERAVEAILDESPPGLVHRRRCNLDCAGNLFVGAASVGGEQDLSELDLARRPFATCDEQLEFLALARVQLDHVTYIHRHASRAEAPRQRRLVQKMTKLFTDKQGQYLAFIYTYTKLHRRPPAEADMQACFGVTPPTVHQMVVQLEKRGLIRRRPGQARSIELLLPAEVIPPLL